MKFQNLNSKLKNRLVNLAKKFDLKLLILFGSRAIEKHSEYSDWDFAFLPNNNFSIEEEMNLFEAIMQLIDFEKIDLINIATSNDLNVINNIFQQGILIYEKMPGLFFEKKWSAWIDFKDFEKYYLMQLEILDKKINKLMV